MRLKLRLLTAAIGFIPRLAIANESEALGQALLSDGLHWLDWSVIALYAFVLIGLGWWYSRKHKDTEDYFLGGGEMKPFIVGISLFVTLLSTISYIAIPGEIIKHGPVVAYGVLAIPLAYFFVSYFIIPILMRQRVTSAYEILEIYLGPKVRLLGACWFIFMRLIWMTVLVFVAANAIVVILGFEKEMVPVVVLVTGLVAVIYTSLGGIKAVMITDFIQFFILISGSVLTIIIVSVHLGGIQWVPTTWSPHWDSQPFFSVNPTVRATVIGAILLDFLFIVCSSGSDQTQVQRYMTTRDTAAAKRAFLIKSVAGVLTFLVVAMTGFAVMGFYDHSPESLPQGESLRSFADQLFPYFIANQLPIGITGLVVSALFAAAMSSLDSGVNSITAVVMTDFLGRYGKTRRNEREHKRIAMILAFSIGTIIVLASSQMGIIPGNFKELTHKTTGLLVPGLFGIFFMALFVRFATPFGVVVGSLYGAIGAFVIAYWDLLTGLPRVSYQLYMLFELIIQLTLACTFSLIPLKGKSTAVVIVWTIFCLLPLIVGLFLIFRIRLG